MFWNGIYVTYISLYLYIHNKSPSRLSYSSSQIACMHMCVYMCTCAQYVSVCMCAYMCVCVCRWMEREKRERDAHRDTSREMLTLVTNSDWAQNNRIHEYSQVSAWFTQKPNKDLRSTDYFSTGYYHIQ